MSDTRSEHPTGSAVAWAAIGYAFGAIFWTIGAAAYAATGAGNGVGDWIGWWLWAMMWIGMIGVVIGFVGVPILILELLLWRLVVLKWPRWERDRIALAQSSAVLALPWTLANPIGEGSALLAFGAAFLGLFLARLSVKSLSPGALLDQATTQSNS